ncbi:MAG: Gfo/Idh/MocA family protein [Armatimonadota bacterium]
MSDKVTIGIVGCGGMAGAHVKGFKELYDKGLDAFEITACCDLEESRASEMADSIAEWQTHRPAVYADAEAMVSTEQGMVAVDICTTHREHHTIAVPALEAGKHVTIEKPLALTMRAGRLILDAAEQAGKLLQVAENYRRSPENRALNWALKSGRIGQPRMVFWLEIRERLWYWAWREHRDQAGGGWPLDGGVHFADLFRYHIGPVRDVYCETRAYQPLRYQDAENMEGPIEVDVEDTIVATLRFDDDVLGQWTSTSAAPGCDHHHRVVYGENGALVWGQGLKTREQELTTEQLCKEFMGQLSEDEKERLFPRGVTNGVATELWEFVQAVRGEGDIETDGLEGYRAEAICMALYESAAAGGPVSVADVEDLKLEAYQQDLNEGLGLT